MDTALLALLSTARALVVLYNGTPVADLRQLGNLAMQLQYRQEIVAEAEGQQLLSVRLPVRIEPFPDEVVRSFLEGYLPEGEAHRRLTRKFHLADEDVFGLLAEIGRDCAGALSFVPEPGSTPQARQDPIQWLEEARLEQLLNELPINPLADDPHENVRLSLAGAQDKMAIILDDQGRYGLPRGALPPTTHILKPEPVLSTRSGRPRFPGLVENEAFCMRLAANVGLEVAETGVRRIGGQRVLVVTRYDRRWSNGGVERIHQEDSCQALGIRSHRKYEEHGGPGVKDILNLLRAFCANPARDVLEFLDRTAFNYLVGNLDAHGKNVSLLHGASVVTLSPAYDVVCTVVYPTLAGKLAMAIGGQFQADQVTARHWLLELDASSLNTAAMRRRLAVIAGRVLDQLEPTRRQANEEGFEHAILDGVEQQVRTHANVLKALPQALSPRGRPGGGRTQRSPR